MSELPPASDVPRPLDSARIIRIAEYGVGSWRPTPDGSGPAMAVVLYFRLAGFEHGEFGLRMSSAERVNELIAMLERHRNDVWPNK